MPLPDVPVGWVPSQVFNSVSGAQPPQYILDAIGGSYDQSKYYWDQEHMALVDRTTGDSYGYGHIPDPSLGTDVVTNLSGYNANGPTDPGTFHFGEGVNPYIAFPDGAYNAGLTPNSGLFLSADPNEIADYSDSRRDRNWQGIGRVGAVVGGGAALGGTGSGPLFGGAAPAAGSGSALSEITLPSSVAPYGTTTAASVGTGNALAGGAAGVGAGVPAVGATPGIAGGAGATVPAIGGAAGAGGNFLQNWLPYITGGVNSLLGYRAADEAADAEAAGLQAAIDEQRRQYDINRSDLMPWLDAGRGALGRLQNPNAFTASPGYEWLRNEGQRDIGNSFAARGGAASGNALRALSEFQTGLAQQDYNNWYNREAGLAGVGQNTAVNLGASGANMAGNVGNALANQGISRASGVLGRYSALGQGLQDATANWLYRRPRR